MVNLKQLIENLNTQDIIQIVTALGADKYIEQENCIIFPTICHNIDSLNANMKLYYYKNDHRFHCYTECSDTFNIFELIKRVWRLQNKNTEFSDILKYVLTKTNYQAAAATETVYHSYGDKYKIHQRNIELPIYDEQLLHIFTKGYPDIWLKEGITKKSMDKYNIYYSISQNKIIIPHYNINGELIGIRGRALNEYDIENFGKYMPIKIEQTLYAHPLSQNIYGLNISKPYINKIHKICLFEAEKSCMLYDGYFNDNIAAAVCGSNFNKAQLNLILNNCDINEIILCFDKEYQKNGTAEAEKYFKKLMDICNKYKNYINMSFIYDMEDIIGLKDSPIDQGREKFIYLFNKRIKTWQVLQ